VNAHAHLELTCLQGRLVRFSSFCDWLSQLVLQRRQWKREDYIESARRGSEMAVNSGTTLIGDISASGVSWEALRSARLRKVVFEEALSSLPERAGEILASLEDRLNKREPDALLCPGISPHAPYSVSAQLFRPLCALARRTSLPLAIHAAETQEELEFLDSGTGEFREFLTTLGVLPDAYQPPRMKPIPYLENLGILESPSSSSIAITWIRNPWQLFCVAARAWSIARGATRFSDMQNILYANFWISESMLRWVPIPWPAMIR